MTVTHRFRGLRQIDQSLARLPERIQKRVAGNAARSGARVLRRGMIARVAKLTGELARSIVVRAVRGRPGHAVVGFLQPASRIAHLIEFGTRFAAAQPFARPTLESDSRAAIAATAKTAERGIAREAAKLRRRPT